MLLSSVCLVTIPYHPQQRVRNLQAGSKKLGSDSSYAISLRWAGKREIKLSSCSFTILQQEKSWHTSLLQVLLKYFLSCTLVFFVEYAVPVFSVSFQCRETLLHFIIFLILFWAYIRYSLSEVGWSVWYSVCRWSCTTDLINGCLLFLFASFSSCVLTWFCFSVPSCSWADTAFATTCSLPDEMLVSFVVLKGNRRQACDCRKLFNIQPQKRAYRQCTLNSRWLYCLLYNSNVECIF